MRLQPVPLCAFAIAIALGLAGAATAGPTFNVIFHAQLDQHPGYNDIWGCTAPNGDEYALLGCTTGLSIVNVSDPDAPYETGFLPGATSTWRDIKTYGHYAYVTNESSGGIAIVDLSNPESPVAAGSYTGGGLTRAHNLYIDTTTGRLYTAGSNLGAGGTRILSLADPVAPAEVGSWETAYFHDVVVQDHILFGSAINAHILYVLDVTDPAAIPAPLGTAQGYPAAFTHNAWPTPDGLYVMTTDETASSSCRMWDMGTLPTLAQTDSYKPNAGTIPHNTQIEGNFAYISFYTLGVKIVDVSDPFDLTEVGAYDTWPADDGSTYDGCWGAFPYFVTNPDLLVVSDIANGLYVLEFKGPLGTLAGDVHRASNPSVAIPGATVRVMETGVSVQSDTSGVYSLQDTAGSVTLEVTAFGYEPATIPATITSGVTTPLDLTLTLVPSGGMSGHVTDAGASLPLFNAEVSVVSTPLVKRTDVAGAYDHDAIPVGSYAVRADAFGYNPMTGDIGVTEGGSLTVDFPMNPALAADTFQDPFPGWIVTGVTTGAWERADPQQTTDGTTVVQPGDDHTPLAGTLCWVTGAAAGPQVGSFDVDGGETVLTSPTFALGSAADPHVSYWRWYATGVSSNPSTDAFTVRVSTDGGGTWTVLEETGQSSNGWVNVDVRLRSLITPSNLTTFQFTARDTGAASVTEALIDDFMIYDGPDHVPTGAPIVALPPRALDLSAAYPNPCRVGEPVALQLALPAPVWVVADVHDVLGRRVATLVDARMDAGRHGLTWSGRDAAGRPGAAGLYFLRVRAGAEERTRKILMMR